MSVDRWIIVLIFSILTIVGFMTTVAVRGAHGRHAACDAKGGVLVQGSFGSDVCVQELK